jgi:hypothetical protein
LWWLIASQIRAPLRGQIGEAVDATAANIMIADAQYIIAQLPAIPPPGGNV